MIRLGEISVPRRGWLRCAGRMLGFDQLLLLHEDADELCQCGDLLVLHADDGQQFEHHQDENRGDAQESDGAVVDAEAPADPVDAVGPGGEREEGKSEQEEDQGIALLQPIPAQTHDGQNQQAAAKDDQNQALDEHRHHRFSRAATAREPCRG